MALYKTNDSQIPGSYRFQIHLKKRTLKERSVYLDTFQLLRTDNKINKI